MEIEATYSPTCMASRCRLAPNTGPSLSSTPARHRLPVTASALGKASDAQSTTTNLLAPISRLLLTPQHHHQRRSS
ncbi:hypothetical protein DOTSEDRAFT_71274 [Dothistroma septosporum NZE10]|uniref:Uncharacterized protein n=1 Tax=Dothistroma septosporum (strain NZE10 / CBS 128990) TaxID=675120 RepID=N1PPZ9_DOTSN|nr:hypothetical protein DOTSEDRAFT_71274 [Dothistroma septosporum NZE10]